MTNGATEHASPSVLQMEADIDAQHGQDEIDSQADTSWNDDLHEEQHADDGEPADWSEGDEPVEEQATASEEAPAETPAATAPTDTPAQEVVAQPDAVAQLAAIAERQAALLERLAPPAEPKAEPAPQAAPEDIDLNVAYDQDPDFRNRVLEAMHLDPTSPYDVTLGASIVQAKQAERRAAAIEAKFQAFVQQMEQRELAAVRQTAEQTLAQKFAAKMSQYEAVDNDINDLFHAAAKQAVGAGFSPDEAIGAVFGKLGKLLRPKTSAAPAAAAPQAAPAARRQVSPAQAKLERAVSVTGRAAVRAPVKRNTTAALAALEGGSGWGR